MVFKVRTKPKELTILEVLDKRMNLSKQDKQYHYNLKKGYEGELLFDSLTKKLRCECLILNDLLLEVNLTTFQIDSLIITQGKLFYYEVKNQEGDYYYEADKFFRKTKIETANPLLQVQRGESLLHQLLLSYGFKLPIDASVVFINPSFTLYQSPLDQPIIHPTQVKTHLSHLNATPSKLTSRHRDLAERLVSLDIKDSPYKRIPNYHYDELRKGIICLKCGSLSVTISSRQCICQKCGYIELTSKAILRSIQEFKTLFPNEKITTNIIYDWCKIVESKRSIRYVLRKHFKMKGVSQWAYYE